MGGWAGVSERRHRSDWPSLIVGALGAFVALIVLTGCSSASASAPPSADSPAAACVISCPDGYLSRDRHACGGPERRRQYEDVIVVGRIDRVNRADGSIDESLWLINDGSTRPAIDVELGSCSSVIQRLNPIAFRGPETMRASITPSPLLGEEQP